MIAARSITATIIDRRQDEASPPRWPRPIDLDPVGDQDVGRPNGQAGSDTLTMSGE
jgi:hypothetical protein